FDMESQSSKYYQKGPRAVGDMVEQHSYKGHTHPEQETKFYATPGNYVQMTQDQHKTRHKSRYEKHPERFEK
ncbi:hypothetical protein EV182_001562, partial [Spiromyces aspiralis]